MLPLPQEFADMFGWEEQVAAVARVYHDLPEEDRSRAVILANDYGEAGAVDWPGQPDGLQGFHIECMGRGYPLTWRGRG